MAERYQLIVIGGGPGGYTAAIRSAQLGLKTAIVEARDFGGTCLNRGCIPTKALLHTSELYHKAVNDFAELGIKAEGISFDAKQIYARKSAVVAQLRSGVEQLLSANKVAIYNGLGTIVAPGQVKVNDEIIEGDNILIASGSVPSRPPIPGMDSPGVITSDELLEDSILTDGQLPKRLVIIGGGVIGCEFAGVFSTLGSQVTIVEFMDRILPTVDKDISQNLTMIMKKRGVTVNTSSKVTKLEKVDGELHCTFEGKKGEETVVGDIVLVSIGRKANTEGLFGENFSVNMERGLILVDENFQTSVPGVYAIGDVIGGIQLAHKAAAEGMTAVAHIAAAPYAARLDLIPSCIYTDPEIACVGMTEAQAKEAGIQVKVGKYIMSANGKTLIEGSDRGFIKLVFDAETEVVLGAAMMCCRATDMLSELTTAIAQRMTIHEMAAIVRPHPTFNEGVTDAVEAAINRSIYTMPKRTR